ncbi:hypothetical protein [Sinanaerobacter chloroacetimidivorans]|uniref:MrpR N-terminal core-binding domain-containing protein n=1 Tax=Sinanaerobacter chloroacetimidivorans TaxID=2818044 RepID=A0A8J7VXN5_9FIRM|nr:hypothetical protein [Sinanaerobacter chloroacetimidivorans]MBR0596952.1 hypothetical protein [Sinanaerobacter chloroacetimidivorans]
MYREHQKNEYLNHILDNGEKYISNMRSLFQSLQEIEESTGKDFCEFTQAEAKKALASISSRKKATNAWSITALRDYINWCILNSKTPLNENVLDRVRISQVDNSMALKQETVPNIEYLIRILEEGLPEINEDLSMNTIYKAYSLLLFFGFSEQEIVSMTKQEAEKWLNGSLHYGNKIIPLHPVLKKYLDKILDYDEIVWIKGKGVVCYKKLIGGNQLIGAVYNLEGRISNFRNVLSKLNRSYAAETGKSIKLSVRRIFESGIYYRLLQKELIEGALTELMMNEAFSMDRSKYKNDISYQNQLINLRDDYSAWKKAWSYE